MLVDKFIFLGVGEGKDIILSARAQTDAYIPFRIVHNDKERLAN